MFNINQRVDIPVGDEVAHVFLNFYKHPSVIYEQLLNSQLNLHQANQGVALGNKNTFNGKHFLDCRHSGHSDRLTNMIQYFENFTKQKCTHFDENIITNMQKWFANDLNNYKENYWWPHYDQGYTLLIYLNNDNGDNGLNLYEGEAKYLTEVHEHIAPWRPKKNFKLLRHIDTPFNTAILFNAKKLLHGCAINNDKNFNQFRLSQAVFFA